MSADATPVTGQRIRTVYLICHTHTDIGYTDYQDTLFRRQDAIMESAIELCEATADAPAGAQFRWTAEVSSLTEDFLRRAPSALVDRFCALERAGRISVMGLPWHWTSLVSPAVALREMESVGRLRRDHGITIRSAVQSDVNGLAWYWVDLLAASGISRFAMFANPHRGLVEENLPRAFNWVGQDGGQLLVWQGWHYSVGGNVMRFGSDANDRVAARLDAWLAPLEKRAEAGDFPYDFTLINVTNYANADNNWPQHGLSEAVAEWNAAGREPRVEIVTTDQFLDVLERQQHPLPTERGDWADPWVDGVGSTARETAMNRAAERLLPVIETLAATTNTETPAPNQLSDLARSMALYDEHTWGAYSSVSLPEIPFSQSQLVDKRRFAHRAFWVAHEHLAGAARQHAKTVTDGPVEGDPELRRNTAPDIAAAEQSFLVVNATGRERRIVWPVTTDRGSERPHHVLHSMLSDRHYPGMGLSDSGTIKFGAIPGSEPGPGHVDVTLPPYGRAFVRAVADAPEGQLGDQAIANSFYDLRVDPQTGAIARLEDKAEGVVIDAGEDAAGALFAGFLETLSQDRDTIFTSDFITYKRMEWHEPTFEKALPTAVSIAAARMSQLGPEITVTLSFAEGIDAHVTYRLPSHTKCVEVDIVQALTRADTGVRALYWQLAAGAGSRCNWRFDQGGRLLRPEQSVASSCSTWIATHDAVTMTATDRDLALAVVPLDTPLVMPGNIRPIGVFGEPRTEVNALYFWTYNNHWDTNFAAYEVGALPARYRLLTGRALSDAQVQSFAEDQSVAPVVVRAPIEEPRALPPLIEIKANTGDPEALAINFRTLDDGRVAVAIRNRAAEPFEGALRLPERSVAAVALSSPLGEEQTPVPIGDDGVPLSVAAEATVWWTLTIED